MSGMIVRRRRRTLATLDGRCASRAHCSMQGAEAFRHTVLCLVNAVIAKVSSTSHVCNSNRRRSSRRGGDGERFAHRLRCTEPHHMNLTTRQPSFARTKSEHASAAKHLHGVDAMHTTTPSARGGDLATCTSNKHVTGNRTVIAAEGMHPNLCTTQTTGLGVACQAGRKLTDINGSTSPLSPARRGPLCHSITSTAQAGRCINKKTEAPWP